MSTYFVGIDCGTQSAKVAIFDEGGTVITEGRQALRSMSRPQQGVVLHPDDDIWDAISGAARQAMAAFTGAPSDIAAVGICPIRCCKTFLRADGSLVEPVMSWMDDRAYQPYLPADSSLAYVTTLSGYVAHRFTGECKDTAANNIAMQWPVDSDTWDWSDDPKTIVEFGIPREMLFDLQMPGDIIGTLSKSAALATGLPEGITVVATANDKAVEMLGAGPLGGNTALVSLGTYIAAMVPGDVNHKSPASFWTNFACVPNRYLYESNGVRRGMWTLTWFLDLLGPEFAAHALSVGRSRESILEDEARTLAPGSDGLLTVLDWLAPADAPFRKGMFLGFDARHTRGHIYRSILEAIALTMKRNVDAMYTELQLPLERLVISGGGANSDLFMQIFADVFGLPTLRSTHAGGASLGSAMCAAAATRTYASIEAASSAMASPRTTFAPHAQNAARYAQVLTDVLPHIHSATDPLLQRTYPIFQ
jgi:sugar (pentulose or hexulose) kinase